MSTIDDMILNQLDKQKITADQIANIMNFLITDNSKNKFILFLIDNSNTLLSEIDIYKFIREETIKKYEVIK